MEMFNVHQVLAARALLNNGRPHFVSPGTTSMVPWNPGQSQVQTVPSGTMLSQAIARSSPRRPRGEKKPIPDEQKDEKYFERRKRNNLAAKKSRDQRKQREDTIAIRAGLLEKDNASLRAQVSTLREERNSLQALLMFRRQFFQQQQQLQQQYPNHPNNHLLGLLMLEHQQRLRDLRKDLSSCNSDTSLDETVVDLSRSSKSRSEHGTPEASSPSPDDMFRRNSSAIPAT